MKQAYRLALLCCLLPSTHALAGPADYVFVPTVTQGEREVEFKYGEATPVQGNSAQGASLGFGYGATEHWFTEVYLKQERIGSTNSTLAEFENKFQLTETGEYPVDLGFVTELEAPVGGNAPWELTVGPLLQTEFDKLQLNGNLLFTRAHGARDEAGATYTTNLGYQWQAKYRWQPAFEYGLQGMGEVGKWNQWNNRATQNHRLGPAIFGNIKLGTRRAIRYDAAWLVGASSVAPSHTFRMQVEYEF